MICIRKEVKSMAKKVTQKVENKHDIHIMLLGMVAVLAIVGLVLMFNARLTGEVVISGVDTISGKAPPCFNEPLCPGNAPRTSDSQYLAPDGTLRVRCVCPFVEPPVPSTEVIINLK
jgi:hypothetical protein